MVQSPWLNTKAALLGRANHLIKSNQPALFDFVSFPICFDIIFVLFDGKERLLWWIKRAVSPKRIDKTGFFFFAKGTAKFKHNYQTSLRTWKGASARKPARQADTPEKISKRLWNFLFQNETILYYFISMKIKYGICTLMPSLVLRIESCLLNQESVRPDPAATSTEASPKSTAKQTSRSASDRLISSAS